jgi:hypothetical protein
MAGVIRRGACVMLRGLLAAVAWALLAVPASAQAASVPDHLLYEWQPNGSESGPQLVLEEKDDLTGRFGVQCGKSWIFSQYGGGGDDPWSLSITTGVIAGTGEFPGGSTGIGSTYRNAEINYFDFKSAGPVAMTLSGTATDAAAVGTLGLKVYTMTKARKRHGHTIKPKKVLSASCQIQFDAPNFYAPSAPVTEEPAPAE